MSTEDLTAAFRDVDWQDLEQVHDASAKVLPALSNPAALGALWDQMEKDERLARSAESFNAFQKYVLHDDASTGLRLRLHIFNEHMLEEAHNHRASFSSLILRGSYRHVLYGNVEDVWGNEDEPATAVQPRFIQEQTAGTSYTIHHAFVHSTYAIPGTVSLVVQGPRDRASFRIYDLAQGVTRTRVSGAQAPVVQEPGERKLGAAELQATRAELARLGLMT